MLSPAERREHFGHRPYAHVRYAGGDYERHVPLHWLHRPQVARRAKPSDVLACFHNDDLAAVVNFHHWYVIDVNVLQVFEGE